MAKRKSDQFDLASYFSQPISRRSVAQQQVNAYQGARAFVRDQIMVKYKELQERDFGRVLLRPDLTDELQILMTYKGMESARNSSCSLMGQLSSSAFKHGYRLLFDQYIVEEAEELSLQEGGKRRHIDFKLALPEKTFYFSVKTTTRERAPNAWKAELAHLREKGDDSCPWLLVGVFFEAGLGWPIETIPTEIRKVQLDVDAANSGNFQAVGLCDVEAHIEFLGSLYESL